VVGDAGDARKLFDQLRGSNPVTEVKPGVFTAPGANGGTVTFRATSKSGPPTVDVHGIEEGRFEVVTESSGHYFKRQAW